MEGVDEELVSAIIASSRALMAIAVMSIETSPIEVTLAQFRALALLSTGGPQRMSDLSMGLQMSPSSFTRLVERLERKGLVERRPSPASRRSIELHLTSTGSGIVDIVMAVRRREVTAVIDAIAPGRRQAVRAAFADFADAADGVWAPVTAAAAAAAAAASVDARVAPSA